MMEAFPPSVSYFLLLKCVARRLRLWGKYSTVVLTVQTKTSKRGRFRDIVPLVRIIVFSCSAWKFLPNISSKAWPLITSAGLHFSNEAILLQYLLENKLDISESNRVSCWLKKDVHEEDVFPSFYFTILAMCPSAQMLVS